MTKNKDSEYYLDIIVNNDEFDIREDGRVYKNGKLLKTRVNGRGYLVLTLKIEGRLKSIKLHRLIAKKFLPNSNNLPIVMHLDNNKLNPHVSNLKWGTFTENTRQAVTEGNLKTTITNRLPRYKTKLKDKRGEIKSLYESGKTYKELSMAYSTSISTICRIINGYKAL